ncbi:MAG: B12-binding domain-containing radical SAM protein [Planctomycetota bacterium]
MRVLFLYNEVESLGIQYLSAALRRAGHTTGLVFDPKLFDFFRHEYNSSLLRRSFSFEKQVLRRIEEFRPDVVGFSMLTANTDWALNYARQIKQRWPYVEIVAGGYHATATSQPVLETKLVDWIVRGEAEFSMVDLVDSLQAALVDSAGQPVSEDGADRESWMAGWGSRRVDRQRVEVGIPNLAWIDEQGFHSNPLRPYESDLDLLGRPDKELFHAMGEPFTVGHFVMWRRGCPWGCTFCSNNYYRREYFGDRKDWMFTKDFVRSQSVEHALAELRDIKARCNPRLMRVNDDDICCDEEWLREMSERMTDAERIPFKCFVIPNNVNERTIKYLKKMGCQQIQMGVQSLNPEIRKLIGRPNSEAQIARAIDLIHQAGIGLFVDQIFGLPGETEEDCKYLERFYDEHPADVVSIYWLDLWGGVEVLQQAVNAGTISQEDADMIAKVAEEGCISTVRRYHNDFAKPYAARIEIRNYFHPVVARFLKRTGLWRVPHAVGWFRLARAWYGFTLAWNPDRWPKPYQGYDVSWTRIPRLVVRYAGLRFKHLLTGRMTLPMTELPPLPGPRLKPSRHTPNAVPATVSTAARQADTAAVAR